MEKRLRPEHHRLITAAGDVVTAVSPPPLRRSGVESRRTWEIKVEVVMDARLVSRDAEIMSGALCFAGTRVPLQNLFDYLEGSSSLDEFLEDFPSVPREIAVAVLEAARASLFADAAAA